MIIILPYKTNMSFTTAFFALSAVVGSTADGVRKVKARVSASEAQRGVWWGPAPAPATWVSLNAPTWAAPAPAPATWAAPVATPTAKADGCRAAWIPAVSASSFSPDVCTLSGYYKKKLAQKGELSNDNSITAIAGYDSFFQVQSVYDLRVTSFDPAGAAGSEGSKGYISDLVIGGTDKNVNPFLKTGWSYCQCVAVAVHGCDPTHTFADYAVLQNIGNAERRGDLANTFGSKVGAQTQIPEWSKFNDSLTQARSLTSPTTAYDSPRDAAAVQALVNSLNPKLDKCAPVALSFVESPAPGGGSGSGGGGGGGSSF